MGTWCPEMCGIVGVVSLSMPSLVGAASRLNNHQTHRGPDHQEAQLVAEFVALGYSRLAIVGIGPDGNQPIRSRSGLTTAVFNGEIYNYRELIERYALPPCPSDSYAFAELWERFGAKSFELLRGMFGGAIFDHRSGDLTLVRDRFGIKPLYYAEKSGAVYFASELRALVSVAFPSVPELDPDAITQFLTFGALPAGVSPFKDVKMVLPGEVVRVSVDSGSAVMTHLTNFAGPDIIESEPEIGRFRSVLQDSVLHHLEADIDVSLLLSAGVDSTMIAMAARDLGRKLTCLTVSGSLYGDETAGARRTATAYGHNYQSVPVDLNEGMVTDFFHNMQRPSIDGLNTYLVCGAVAAAGFRVALSGLGGDEAMAGYSHARLLPYVRARARLGNAGNLALKGAAPLLQRATMGKLKLSRMLAPEGPDDAMSLCSLQRELFAPATVEALTGRRNIQFPWSADTRVAAQGASVRAWAAAERSIYLESTLLPDADAFSMAHSVELRVPFVDHVLRSFTLGVPERLRRKQGKARFVNAVNDAVLQTAMERPKTGFTIPMPALMQSGVLRAATSRARNPDAAIWNHLDYSAGSAILKSANFNRWSEMWSIVALNSWIESFSR